MASFDNLSVNLVYIKSAIKIGRKLDVDLLQLRTKEEQLLETALGEHGLT